jgi:hypothetical protein
MSIIIVRLGDPSLPIGPCGSKTECVRQDDFFLGNVQNRVKHEIAQCQSTQATTKTRNGGPEESQAGPVADQKEGKPLTGSKYQVRRAKKNRDSYFALRSSYFAFGSPKIQMDTRHIVLPQFLLTPMSDLLFPVPSS